MSDANADDTRNLVRDHYAKVSTGNAGCAPGCRAVMPSDQSFQIARSSVAEHMRTRARHPIAAADAEQDPATETDEDDREAARELAGCVSMFVTQLPSPCREAITLVELEGRTTKEAAEMVGISVSGMKSRVQRGRAQLRGLFDRCCDIALDARGKPADFTPRPQPSCKTCS